MTASTAASATQDKGLLTSTGRRNLLKPARRAQRREADQLAKRKRRQLRRAAARSLGATALAVGLTVLLSVPSAPAVSAGGAAVGKLAPAALWMPTLTVATRAADAAAETPPVPEGDGLVGDGTGGPVTVDELLNATQYPVRWPFDGPVRVSRTSVPGWRRAPAARASTGAPTSCRATALPSTRSPTGSFEWSVTRADSACTW